MSLICTDRDNGLAVAISQPLSGIRVTINRLVRVIGWDLPVCIYISCLAECWVVPFSNVWQMCPAFQLHRAEFRSCGVFLVQGEGHRRV